jgi:hypothetical protein
MDFVSWDILYVHSYKMINPENSWFISSVLNKYSYVIAGVFNTKKITVSWSYISHEETRNAYGNFYKIIKTSCTQSLLSVTRSLLRRQNLTVVHHLVTERQ